MMGGEEMSNDKKKIQSPQKQIRKDFEEVLVRESTEPETPRPTRRIIPENIDNEKDKKQ